MERFVIARTDKGGEGGTVTFALSDKTDRSRRRHLAAGGRREGRDPDAVRLPHGHLPDLRAAAGIGPRPRLPVGNRARRGRPNSDLHLRGVRRLHHQRLGDLSMAITDIKEYAHLTPEDVEELARELDAIRSRHRGVPRRARRPLHPQGHPAAARACRRRPNRVVRQPEQVRVDGGHRHARRGQDHREHGTRAQHHPRSVGLDERPGDPLHRVGVGHHVADACIGRSRTTSSTTSTPTSSGWTTTSATASCGSPATSAGSGG